MEKLLEKLRNAQVFITMQGDDLKVSFDGDTLPEDVLHDLKTNKRELINYLQVNSFSVKHENIPNTDWKPHYPLSSAQQRIWLSTNLQSDHSLYTLSGGIRIIDKIAFANLNAVFQDLIARHEILRTVFKKNSEGEIRQYILPISEINFELSYLNYEGNADKESLLNQYFLEEANKPFDLEKGPLLRAALIQFQEGENILHFNMHHIISDGWSMNVMYKDLFSFYRLHQGFDVDKPNPLKIQYKDYAQWQLDQMSSNEMNSHLSFWKEQLAGELPVLELPHTRPRPRVKTHRGNCVLLDVNFETTQELREIGKQEGGSMFMTLLAVWNVLFYRYSGAADNIIGTPAAGRDHIDLQNQIGVFLNTLALRNRLDPQENFISFYKKVVTNTLEAYKHQSYPFEKLVDELIKERDLSRSPVFDVLLTVQTTESDMNDFYSIGFNSEEIKGLRKDGAKFDLHILIDERQQGLSFTVYYNTDVYEDQMIQQLIAQFGFVLNNLKNNLDVPIAKIQLFSQDELSKMIQTSGNCTSKNQNEMTFSHAFDKIVLKYADCAALAFGDRTLSYRDLDDISTQFANYLIEKSEVSPNDRVGILLDNGDFYIIAILGIIKCRAAYVPLDTSFPKERRDFIIEDSNCQVVVDDNFISRFQSDRENLSTNLKQYVDPLPDDAVYVIYTSGTSGKPKGVEITSACLFNYTTWLVTTFNINNTDSSLLSLSLTWDGVLTSLFGCLAGGATLHVLNKEDVLNAELTVKYICNQGITFLKGTPSYFNMLLGVPGSKELFTKSQLQLLFSGGDVIDLNFVDRVVNNSDITVVNHYGPTETTIGAIFQPIDKQSFDNFKFRPCLGQPIDNTQIYIFSQFDEIQPPGVIGEICIGGAGLAKGYVNNETLTADKFVSNPYRPGEKIYRTGDLGYCLPDGKIVFIGRNDDQLKIRGYRIEPAEIEKILSTHDQISGSKVLGKTDHRGEKILIAFYVVKKEVPELELREFLLERLPFFMQPNQLIQIDYLPLKPNGKIDFSALSAHFEKGTDKHPHPVDAKTTTEIEVLELWKEILGTDSRISMKDDFFSLGGNSIKAVKLLMSYKKKFGVMLEINEFFEHVTPAEHVSLIEVKGWVDQTKQNGVKNDPEIETITF